MRRGFTLAEILIAVALGMVLFSTIAVATSAFARSRNLEATQSIVVSYLRTAFTRAMQSEGNSPHGVAISGGTITLFRGASYAARQTAYDQTWSTPGYLAFSGVSETVFSKQAAVPSATGNITISNGSRSVTVTVHSTGAISQP